MKLRVSPELSMSCIAAECVIVSQLYPLIAIITSPSCSPASLASDCLRIYTTHIS